MDDGSIRSFIVEAWRAANLGHLQGQSSTVYAQDVNVRQCLDLEHVVTFISRTRRPTRWWLMISWHGRRHYTRQM